MKKLLLILFAGLLICPIGCFDDEDGGDDSKTIFEGTWVLCFGNYKISESYTGDQFLNVYTNYESSDTNCSSSITSTRVWKGSFSVAGDSASVEGAKKIIRYNESETVTDFTLNQETVTAIKPGDTDYLEKLIFKLENGNILHMGVLAGGGFPSDTDSEGFPTELRSDLVLAKE
ncbi:MAG: hypothetical protein GY754_02245 [bacterium]|nr:hypothetical protein [bacterium]